MARLRSLNCKIIFDTNYDKVKPYIFYKNKKVEEIPLTITSFDQIETITFENFSPIDNKQKVLCKLVFEGREINLQSIATFQMAGNKFVENIEIENCIDVHFNGEMTIQFCKDWFKHILLSGANIGDGYCNWEVDSFEDKEIYCVGDSFTYGQGVASDQTWPYLLNRDVCNFGSKGLGHDGCLMNIHYILSKSTRVRQIICLLPPNSRRLLHFDLFGEKCVTSIGLQNKDILPYKLLAEANQLKDTIIKDTENTHWIQICHDIIQSCKQKNIKIWLSTWDENLHDFIPSECRLPLFPKLETFAERASDNLHPHKKHYELFAENIRPYVDKTTK